MSETDEMIVDKVLNGDKNAYAILVERYKDKVFSLVVGILRNDDQAGELVQEIFIRAYTALNKFRKESKFSTWIYRIAYNATISETRKKRQKARSYDEQVERMILVDPTALVENEELMEHRKKLLHKALQQLSPEDRMILMLYYFDDLPVEEISKTAGLTKANVKVPLFRLRNKLKEMMIKTGNVELMVY